jgi:hypothetical protein
MGKSTAQKARGKEKLSVERSMETAFEVPAVGLAANPVLPAEREQHAIQKHTDRGEDKMHQTHQRYSQIRM